MFILFFDIFSSIKEVNKLISKRMSTFTIEKREVLKTLIFSEVNFEDMQ